MTTKINAGKKTFGKLLLAKARNEKLVKRIINEMLIEPEHMDMWNLAKEIWYENQGRFKKGITLDKIYRRLIELKKEDSERG